MAGHGRRGHVDRDTVPGSIGFPGTTQVDALPRPIARTNGSPSRAFARSTSFGQVTDEFLAAVAAHVVARRPVPRCASSGSVTPKALTFPLAAGSVVGAIVAVAAGPAPGV